MNATRGEWRPVVGFEGFYEVSRLGLVRSLDRIVLSRTGVARPIRGRELKTYPAVRMGYPMVKLSRDGIKYGRYVHRLVLEAFVGPRPEGAVACHNDGDCHNNSAQNLRWDSQRSNILDIVRHGRHFSANKTHCKHGHPFDAENTYMNPSSGQRVCRTCIRNINRRIKFRKKQQLSGAASELNSLNFQQIP